MSLYAHAALAQRARAAPAPVDDTAYGYRVWTAGSGPPAAQTRKAPATSR